MRFLTRVLDNRWALFLIAVLGILASYGLTSVQQAGGQLLLPLDDVYIHFQYGRQMALGDPYVYNPGAQSTSGATSFLYPYLLAAGYWLGFQGLRLGLWALIVGAVALLAAMWAVALLVDAYNDAPRWAGTSVALAFGLTGSVAWHAMSGMETALMLAFVLWTLLCFVRKSLRGFVIAATLLSLTRPEGSLMAAGASLLMVVRLWRDTSKHERHRAQLLWLLVPVVAMGVQPFVNWLVTGSSVATGNQAKSILAAVPPDTGQVVTRIFDNFIRLWREFITGYAPAEGWYVPVLLVPLGLVGLLYLFFKRDWRLVGLLVTCWLVGAAAAISTLDTAFWHFKRYQMPLLALFYPLAAWALLAIGRHLRKPRGRRIYAISTGVGGMLLAAFLVILFGQFLSYYAVNVRYVYEQPYAMSQWLRENTPEDVVIAVHDVGMMRYVGNRTTLDMVGLTTPNAAAYWRNGPGSVGEFLMQQQPDYIASYGRGHGYGLYMLQAHLYGEPLATFEIEGWQRWHNVALAADTQGIYAPQWEGNTLAADTTVYDAVDVADVMSENDHTYAWDAGQAGAELGFPTVLLDATYTPYLMPNTEQQIRDSYRVNVTREVFTLRDVPDDSAVLLISRVQAGDGGVIDIYTDDTLVATRHIPQMPGHWFDVPTRIPADRVSSEMNIQIVGRSGMTYQPAHHWIQPAADTGIQPVEDIVGASEVTYQNERVGLSDWSWSADGQFSATWLTDGTAAGDYRMFVHLYDDEMQPPVAQWDGYWRGQPMGNWLIGAVDSAVQLDLNAVDPGAYSLALGFYDPAHPNQRLIPTSDTYEVTRDGRVWFGTVEVMR